MSTEDPLVKMSNQIAANFRHHPEEQAAAEVATHLKAFWTPRMLDQLAARVAEEPGRFDDLVLDAVERLKTSA